MFINLIVEKNPAATSIDGNSLKVFIGLSNLLAKFAIFSIACLCEK